MPSHRPDLSHSWIRISFALLVSPALMVLAGCGSSGGGYVSTGYPYNDFYYDRWGWGGCCYSPGYPIGPPDRPPARPEHPIERPPARPTPPIARPPRPTPRPLPARPRPGRMR